MSQTLYRKYRSQRFSEIIGQKPVTRILLNSIRRERISHAYLFCGPRGTGKTSIARIFAKALNCLNPQEGDACGVCENCVSIAQGNAVDVIEIDAASRNKVDDVRELRDRVGYGPISFSRKIYIIDEAHMITSQGFNALLKTLEEPPGFVVFCLCTTEAHKLPVTILSRCIRLDFQRLPAADLSAHLLWIAKEEGFVLDSDAALELVKLSEGSARDAISLLDQLTVYCTDRITLQDLRELFQESDYELITQAADLLDAGEAQPLIALWDEQAAHGSDASRFLLSLADELLRRYIERRTPGLRAGLEALWQGVNLLKFESYPGLLVQLTLLKAQDAMAGSGNLPQTSFSERQTSPGVRVDSGVQNSARTEARPIAPAAENARATEPALPQLSSAPPRPTAEQPASEQGRPAAASAPVGEKPTWSWDAFLETMEQQAMTTYPLLLPASAECMDGLLTISYGPADRTIYTFLGRDEHQEKLRRVAAVFGIRDVRVRIDEQPEAAGLPAGQGPVVTAEPEAAPAAPISDTVEASESERPVTPQEAMELFGAIDLDEED